MKLASFFVSVALTAAGSALPVSASTGAYGVPVVDDVNPAETALEGGESAAAAEAEAFAITRAPVMPVRLEIRVDLSSQTLTVRLDGQYLKDFRGNAQWLVSSGKNQWVEDKTGSRYYAETPRGTFTPFRRNKTDLEDLNHVSGRWKVKMPYSVFFTGGIAIHAAVNSAISLLGKNVSGGCVRVHPKNAAKIFDLVVRKVGRPATRITVVD